VITEDILEVSCAYLLVVIFNYKSERADQKIS
jgi:hypothetical protein